MRGLPRYSSHFVTRVFTRSVQVAKPEGKAMLTTRTIETLKPGRQRYEKSEPSGAARTLFAIADRHPDMLKEAAE